MLQAQNISKSYILNTVLSQVSFVVNSGEHVGLIGPNGSGKSTLLKILTGHEQPDKGHVTFSTRDLRLGYLAQSFSDSRKQTLREAIREAQGELSLAEAAMQRAADALSTGDDIEALSAYDQALQHFEALGGYEREQAAQAILQGLGLGEIDPDLPVAALSGGQKTRLGLATLLVQQPELLLLDEPTNHLDVDALEWLETFVRAYRGAVLIVSHDREFLDRTVSRVLYLDPGTHTLKSYTGNYSDFAGAREQEREAQKEAWTRQQEYIGKVGSDIARLKGQALAMELGSTPRQPGLRKYARKKAGIAKSREKKLARYMEAGERVDKPAQQWWLKLDFGAPPQSGRAVLRMEQVSFAYPDGTAILQGASLEVAYGGRLALVGPNGAGKSTVLKLIDGTLLSGAGEVRIGSNVRMGRLSQEQETLNPEWTVLQTALQERPMNETDARSFLHFFLFEGDSVFRHTSECSLGERTRLQLALLVLRGCNLLLLDEPLNHLDIEGREHFEAALESFEGTVIVVSHDRAFLHAYPERVVEVSGGKFRSYEGYDDYLAHRSGVARC